MSSDNIVTHEHLATIEKYMAQQIEMQQKGTNDLYETLKQTQSSLQQTQVSMQQLAANFNELVLAEKYREEKDQKTTEVIKENKAAAQKQIDEIKTAMKENADGIRWANKMSKWVDNYIMKIAVPFVMTAIIIIIVANTFDLNKLAGG